MQLSVSGRAFGCCVVLGVLMAAKLLGVLSAAKLVELNPDVLSASKALRVL